MDNGNPKMIEGSTEKAGRDISDEFSDLLGERLAKGLLNIPHVRQFAHAIRKINGISPERAVRTFHKKFMEGL